MSVFPNNKPTDPHFKQGRCNHACHCKCHRTAGLKHVMACCRPCKVCSVNIKIRMIQAHMQECHSEENEGVR